MASAVPLDITRRALPRVLIVDDSAVARAVLGRVVADSGRYFVAGAVGGAEAALAFLAHQTVDLVLLDLAMPGTDGLTALPDLLAASGDARIVVVSASAGDGAADAVRALALGAADTLAKPVSIGDSSTRFRTTLLARLDRLRGEPEADVARVAPPVRAVPTVVPGARPASLAYAAMAIGASTGGIHALGRLLGALPASFRAPILVTQHLPASFMPYFAAQLAALGGRPADVATDRMRLRPGRIVVAPGDAHLRCVALPGGEGAVRLHREPQPSGCTPSADPMFASAADVFGPLALGVMLSGMGRDGADGARRLREAGGTLLVQDRATSVVWGMPGAVASFADAILPPEAIAARAAGVRA